MSTLTFTFNDGNGQYLVSTDKVRPPQTFDQIKIGEHISFDHQGTTYITKVIGKDFANERIRVSLNIIAGELPLPYAEIQREDCQHMLWFVIPIFFAWLLAISIRQLFIS
ncbi:MAG: hypothetical protein ACMG6E_00185 [Candidatus Roizmanbacteria bacterium]